MNVKKRLPLIQAKDFWNVSFHVGQTARLVIRMASAVVIVIKDIIRRIMEIQHAPNVEKIVRNAQILMGTVLGVLKA